MGSTIPHPPIDSLAGMLRSKSTQDRHDLGIQVQLHRASRAAESMQGTGPSTVQEFVIPMRLATIQKKIYKSLILKNAASIEAFCKDPSDRELSSSIHTLIDLLNATTTHPLLVAESPSSPPVSEVEDAWYIVQASSKFELLIDLVETLRQHPLRIAIISNDEKLSALLIRVFKGIQVRYSRTGVDAADASTQDNSLGQIEILLVSDDIKFEESNLPDLTITFDNASTSSYTPTLRFITNHSAEHVARQTTDLAMLISVIANLSGSVGICSYDSGEIIEKLVHYFSGDALKLEELQEISFTSSQFEELSYTASNGERPSVSRGKFTSDDNMIDVEPTPQIVITEIDGFEVHTEAPIVPFEHIATDRVDREGTISLPQQAQQRPLDLTNYDEILSHHDHEQTQFVSPIHLEKKPSQIFEQTPNPIWTRNTPDQDTITSLEADIERMMLRFDDLRAECRALAELKDDAQAQASLYHKRLERALEECRTSRAEKNEIKLELDGLKMPALPEKSSPDYLSTENQRLRTELEKAKKSSNSKLEDFEFVRQQYQQASSAAAELASENEILSEQIRSVTNKVEGGLGYKAALAESAAELQALRAESENLTLRNNVLIEQLRRMRDEKFVNRGRADARRENTQERKRATSACDVGQRKKLDKLGASRLSVASLIAPPSAGDSRVRIEPQVMIRGHSHDASAFSREKERQTLAARSKAPF